MTKKIIFSLFIFAAFICASFSNNSKNTWDILYTYKASQMGAYGCFYWDEKVYVAGFDPIIPGNEMGKIWRFTINGNTLEPDGFVVVPGLTGYYNFEGFTTDGTYIYGVNESNYMYKIDPNTWTIVDEIFVSVGIPAGIAYDRSTGGFWLSPHGGYMARHVSATGELGQVLNNGGAYVGIMGIAYDDFTDGGPYLVTANGASSSFNMATLGRWNIATGVYEEFIYDLSTLPGGVPNNNIMGNIGTYMKDGKLILLGTSQQAELVFAVELATSYSIEAPAPVSNLTITPNPQCELSALLEWKNPTLTVSGAPLTELTAINIYQDDEIMPIHTISNPVMGADVNYTVTVATPAHYSFSVSAVNSAGESDKEQVSAWIGEDVPKAPQNIRLDQLIPLKNDNMVALLSWAAPTEGVNNECFSGTDLKYDVFRFPEDLLVSENQTDLFFTETLTEEGEYWYRVLAKNNAGIGEADTSNTLLFTFYDNIFSYKENITFNIYPNPVNNILTISYENADKARVEIFNSLGKMIQSFELNQSETKINLSNFSSGIYLIRLYDEYQNCGIQRFIKE